MPVSCVLLRHRAGQRAVRHRLPSVGAGRSGGALGRPRQVHDADHAARRQRDRRTRRHWPEPDDIDVVVCSHLHPDHCGCNAFFKRATFIIHAGEIEAARAPGAEARLSRRRNGSMPRRPTRSPESATCSATGASCSFRCPATRRGRSARWSRSTHRRVLPGVRHGQPARDARYRHYPAQHLERATRWRNRWRRSGISRRTARPSSAATTRRNGPDCAKGADAYD